MVAAAAAVGSPCSSGASRHFWRRAVGAKVHELRRQLQGQWPEGHGAERRQGAGLEFSIGEWPLSRQPSQDERSKLQQRATKAEAGEVQLLPNSTLLGGHRQDGAQGQKGRCRELTFGKGLVPKDGASQEDLAKPAPSKLLKVFGGLLVGCIAS